MLPIILCSIISAAICVERFWTLRTSQVVPRNLLAQVWNAIRNGELDNQRLRQLRAGSPLGRLLAAGITSHRRGREQMKEAIEEVASSPVYCL